jgi:hypothetical protein
VNFSINLKPNKNSDENSQITFDEILELWNNFMEAIYENESEYIHPFREVIEKQENRLFVLFSDQLNLSSIVEMKKIKIINLKINHHHNYGFVCELTYTTRLGNISYSFSDKFGIDTIEEYDYQTCRFTEEIEIFPIEAATHLCILIKRFLVEILQKMLTESGEKDKFVSLLMNNKKEA